MNFNHNKPISTLEWTGPNINAVELVYALYYARVINNGQADIIEIARLLNTGKLKIRPNG